MKTNKYRHSKEAERERNAAIQNNKENKKTLYTTIQTKEKVINDKPDAIEQKKQVRIIKELNKKIQQQEAETRNEQKKNAEISRQLNIQKQENRRYIHEQKEQQQQIHELKEVIKTHDADRERYTTNLNIANHDINKLNEYIRNNNIEKLIEKNKRLKIENQNKNHQITALRESNKKGIKTLERKVNDLRKELNNVKSIEKKEEKTQTHIQAQINSIEHLMPSYGLFLHLTNQMTIDNYSSFKHFTLIERKYYALYNKDKKNEKYIKPELEQVIIPTVTTYGYILKNNSGIWQFISIDDDKTYVITNEDQKKLYHSYPAKAVILNNEAHIITIFYEHINEHEFIKKYREPKKSKSNQTQTYIGNFKVLIIGSRNMTKYKNKLESHGLIVDTYNSYEESRQLLDDKLRRADVILYLTSHSNHLDQLKKDEYKEKVESIKVDNIDVLSVRTRYAGIRLNLI